jgi:hypothetical protein
MERATGIEPVLPAWESEFSILYFQYLQTCSEKMYVHALHTVHVLPDLRVAAGRLRDGVSILISTLRTVAGYGLTPDKLASCSKATARLGDTIRVHDRGLQIPIARI